MHDVLKFHSVFGNAVVLEENGVFAARDLEATGDGIIFSRRPIKTNERICLELTQVNCWLGALRVGVTSRNPDTLDQSGLPHHVFPTAAKDVWVRPIREGRLRSGSCVTVFSTKEGELQYSINGDCASLLITGIPTTLPLWLVVDLYGNTTAVRIVKPGTY